MFNKDDRVKVTSDNQHSPHEGKIGIVEQVGDGLYYVRFSADDADYIAEADLTVEPPPTAAPTQAPAPAREAVVTVHQPGSLVDYGAVEEEEEEEEEVQNPVTPTTATSTTDTWRWDENLNAWSWQDFYKYSDGRCYDARTGTMYQTHESGYLYSDSGWFYLDTTKTRDNWLVRYEQPQPTTTTVQGVYDRRTGKTFYPTGEGRTFLDEDGAQYFYDGRRYEPLLEVQAPMRESRQPAASSPAPTHHEQPQPRTGARKRRLEVDENPRTPAAPTEQEPVRTAAPARTAQSPAQANFTVDGYSFVLEFQSGGRNEQLGHSATRHGEEYQRSVERGTQGLREIMYNARVYSEDQYQRQQRRACLAAARLCETDPGNYGQMLEVVDDNQRLWNVILARGNGPRTYRVRHTHFENYQNQ